MNNEIIYNALIKNCNKGVLLCRKEDFKILEFNEKAAVMLDIQDSERSFVSLNDLLEPEIIKIIIEDSNTHNIEVRGTIVQIHCISENETLFFLIDDISDVDQSESISQKAIALSKEMISVFNKYGDDSIMITDKYGNVEYMGAIMSMTCGVEADFFIGKSVYDIEKEGIFTPSVTVKVLNTKQLQVVVQKTKIGKELVSVGAPVFDSEGELEKVISVTRDFTTQIKVSKMIAELNEVSQINLDLGSETNEDHIITCNDKMFEIKTLIKMIAETKVTVLVNGETGTGKEVIARYIYKLSDRKDKPFIKVNCGTISPSIVESELFGYEGGSFTGANKEGKIGLIEAANGGTLFLDEISELPMEQQVKLLHVLQEKMLIRVGGTTSIDLDIRVIAASNKDLRKQVEEGLFREDLYYRLNVVPIDIPPLRERREDIPLLTRYFFKMACETYNKEMQISFNAISALEEYSWPGNIRQLENTIERLVLTTPKPTVTIDDIPAFLKNEIDPSSAVQVKKIIRLDEAISQLEKDLISKAMKKYGTTVKVAEVLGVNQSTISRKIMQYNLKDKK